MTYRVKGKNCILCGKTAIARSLCRNHYSGAYQKGTLDNFRLNTCEEAFHQRYKKTESCWIWTGKRNTAGYGIFLLPGEIQVRAHRHAYEVFKGPIPDGMIIMHSCDNPPCVNPDHLSVGTRADNNSDTAKKRRHNYGLDHWNGKLSAEQIEEIRNSKSTCRALAAKFGVTYGYISALKRGKSRPKGTH
jgi:hypothetical protein